MLIRTAIVLLITLSPPLDAQDDAQSAATAEIKQAFRHHGFDPSIMVPFDRRQLDPLIVHIEWETVRGHVEAALNRLNVGSRPISLPCEFHPLRASDDPKDARPYRLMPVFVFEKGNTRAKSVLKRVLGFGDDALWEYEPERGRVVRQKPVQETRLTTTGDFRPQYVKRNAIDLVQVHIGLQELISQDDNLLRIHHFQPMPAHIVDGRGLHFATVWKLHWKSRYTAIAWRLKAVLERNKQPGTWELIAKIEIGKRYASQAGYTVIGDSMNGHLLGEQMHIALDNGKSTISWGGGKLRLVEDEVPIPGETPRAGVGPPIEMVRVDQVTALDKVGSTFAELCRDKLLGSSKITEAKP
jgi:hypothetical protein